MSKRTAGGRVAAGQPYLVGEQGPERIVRARTIRLYPVEGVHALPWPAEEFDATPDEWADIQQYVPPPFTDKPPGTTPDPATPGPAGDGGSSDSED